MFEHFPHSVGVANIRALRGQLAHPPRYVTPGERGAGFAEVARAILVRRADCCSCGGAVADSPLARRRCSAQACANASSVRA